MSFEIQALINSQECRTFSVLCVLAPEPDATSFLLVSVCMFALRNADAEVVREPRSTLAVYDVCPSRLFIVVAKQTDAGTERGSRRG
ncbi:hypothetical protein EVAR_83479_1 [Eumeta japonica]|uniref:Uncharacterized protein n=1 Tax=Eumeta variegata TaxID=151549 RepID=A0A4C1ZGE6_EUMVA|nr:hypothetical protein EVAR_83479_1 [Eumeta japonica]